jgi:hypothetical protein
LGKKVAPTGRVLADNRKRCVVRWDVTSMTLT